MGCSAREGEVNVASDSSPSAHTRAHSLPTKRHHSAPYMFIPRIAIATDIVWLIVIFWHDIEA